MLVRVLTIRTLLFGVFVLGPVSFGSSPNPAGPNQSRERCLEGHERVAEALGQGKALLPWASAIANKMVPSSQHIPIISYNSKK